VLLVTDDLKEFLSETSCNGVPELGANMKGYLVFSIISALLVYHHCEVRRNLRRAYFRGMWTIRLNLCPVPKLQNNQRH
jgi:hypothetical protein